MEVGPPPVEICGYGPQLKPGRRLQSQGFPVGHWILYEEAIDERIWDDYICAGRESINHSETRGPKTQMGTDGQESSGQNK